MTTASNTVDRVKRVVADEYGITVGELLTSAKRHAAAHPRQLAMWLCRQCVPGAYGRPISTTVLGRLFGRKDHTTAMQALRSTERRIACGDEFADRVRILLHRIASESFRPRSIKDASHLFPALAAEPVKPSTTPIFVIRGMNSTANRGALGGQLHQPVAPRPVAITRGASLYREAAR
jgi:hypothetical protein